MLIWRQQLRLGIVTCFLCSLIWEEIFCFVSYLRKFQLSPVFFKPIFFFLLFLFEGLRLQSIYNLDLWEYLLCNLVFILCLWNFLWFRISVSMNVAMLRDWRWIKSANFYKSWRYDNLRRYRLQLSYAWDMRCWGTSSYYPRWLWVIKLRSPHRRDQCPWVLA